MKVLRPTPTNLKDKHWAFHRHFGTTTNFAESYLVDTGHFPDQNDSNRPTACTAYLICDIIRSETGQDNSEDFQYMETLLAMNVPPSAGETDLRTAFKVPTVIGMVDRKYEPSGISNSDEVYAATLSNWPKSVLGQALLNRQRAYLPIQRDIGQDWFDAIRSSLTLATSNRRTVGIGTQWSPSFETLGADGILPDNPQNLYWGHAYEICGWELINGKTYLVCKTWQGELYGKGGYCYMSRALCNRLMGTWGTYAATYEQLSAATVQQIQAQKVDVLEFILALMQNLYNLTKHGLGLA